MLSDKHVDAAMMLLSGQFSKTSGLQSSLKVQFRLGFRPIDLDKRTRVQGELCNCLKIMKQFFLLYYYYILGVQILFVPERHHWILTSCIEGSVYGMTACRQALKNFLDL